MFAKAFHLATSITIFNLFLKGTIFTMQIQLLSETPLRLKFREFSLLFIFASLRLKTLV